MSRNCNKYRRHSLKTASIAELRQKVRTADAAYRAGNAIMSDADFDALEQQLKAAAPHAPELHQPGGGSKLLSLHNGDAEELDYWLESCGSQQALCVSEKVDGCAIAIRYVEGCLEAAWTRSGTDATELVSRVAPVRLVQPLTCEIRGELYDRDAGKQSAPAVALRKPGHTGKGLAFIAYTLCDAEGDEFSTLDYLASLGFDTVTGVFCSSANEIMRCYEKWLLGSFGQSSLPTDGIVIRVASHSAQRSLGCTSKAPNYAFAMKR